MFDFIRNKFSTEDKFPNIVSVSDDNTETSTFLTDAEIYCLMIIRKLPRSGMRYSRKGVPHVLALKNNKWHSITYFKKRDKFRIRWPYRSNEQLKRDFKDFEDVLKFMRGEIG